MAGMVAASLACTGSVPSATPPRPSVSASVPTPSASPTVVEDPTIELPPSDGDDPSDDVRAPEGALVARLTVPALGLERFPVRMGVGLDVLATSIGIYPGAEYPGSGNFSTAGHRVTPVAGMWHGPYFHLDELRRGDRAWLLMDGRTYVFVLRRVFIVEPTRVSVLWPRRADLTMTACHPPGSLAERIIAFWDLLRTTIPGR